MKINELLETSKLFESELPLPTEVGSIVVFDNGKDDNSMRVSLRPDGTYYDDNGKFDFSRPNSLTMREALRKWGYYHVGWEHED